MGVTPFGLQVSDVLVYSPGSSSYQSISVLSGGTLDVKTQITSNRPARLVDGKPPGARSPRGDRFARGRACWPAEASVSIPIRRI